MCVCLCVCMPVNGHVQSGVITCMFQSTCIPVFDVQVEFVSKVPGSFEEIAEVQLEGKEPQQLKIRGNVAKPALEVLSVKDEQPIKCVPFGNTYYGTDRTEHAILYNAGPEVVNFVAIVDEDAIAQELVCAGSPELSLMYLKMENFMRVG